MIGNMEKEKWMPIDGTNGAYEVSNSGQVRSVTRSSNSCNGIMHIISGRVLKQGIDRYGYRTVVLRIDKINKTFRVHRLVANAFLPRTLGKDYIDHIDTNKSNNHYTNLRWVTRSENERNPITYAKRIQRNLTREGLYSSTAKKVYQYTQDGHLINEYPSMGEAARQNKLGKSGIRFAIQGKYKKCGGFIWTLSPIDKEI